MGEFKQRVTIKGMSGEVRWAYHSAATLKDWSVTAEPTGDTLTASIVSLDTFKASQRPLTFVVARPKGQPWVWPIQSLQVTDTTLKATLGPVE